MARHPLRAGIVGYGYMGEIRHRAIEAHPDLELVGVADPQLEARDPRIGVPIHRSHRELLAAGVDLLFVCTPHNVTADIVCDALAAGRHAFTEKPPGRDIGDVERMIAAERRRPDLKLMFGFNHRYHHAIQDAKAIVDAGSLGRILWLRGVYGKSGGPGFEQAWRNVPQISGGGILLDQGIHMLDLFCSLCGDFEEVVGMIGTTYWDIPVEDNAFVLLRNRAGQMAQLHSSATLWRHTFRLEIGLERGYLIASGILSRSRTYGRESLIIGRGGGGAAQRPEPREETVYYDEDPSWDVQVAQFVRAIREDLPVEESGSREAHRVMRIVDQVYRQAAARREADAVRS